MAPQDPTSIRIEMLRINNENLAKYTTIKIGGPVEILAIPDSEDAFVEEIKRCICNHIPYRILGNGSNLLIRDNGVKGVVILNRNACTELKEQNGIVYCGSSVMLQKLINFCIEHNLYGMEYLYSVPATLGGAVVQNAGRGKQHNKQISDYLTKVKVFDGHKIREYTKNQCEFAYRHSIFQDNKKITVLGAYFELPEQARDEGIKAKRERIDYVKQHQDNSCPNFGTVFSTANGLIMKLLRGFRVGGAKFSSQTPNWICNYNDATAKDVLQLMSVAKWFHKFFLRNVESEVEIW